MEIQQEDVLLAQKTAVNALQIIQNALDVSMVMDLFLELIKNQLIDVKNAQIIVKVAMIITWIAHPVKMDMALLLPKKA